MMFNKEVWNNSVSRYNLIDHKTKKVLNSKYITYEDAGVLNRFYASQKRGEDWVEADWKKDSKKTSKKRKKI